MALGNFDVVLPQCPAAHVAQGSRSLQQTVLLVLLRKLTQAAGHHGDNTVDFDAVGSAATILTLI